MEPPVVDPSEFARLRDAYMARLNELEVTTPGYTELFSRFEALVCAPGQLVVVTPWADTDLAVFIAHGARFDGRSRMVRGEPNACHENTARLWLEGRVDAVVTGYALSGDGLWRQHTAGLGADGAVVETTVGRVEYFAATLTDVGSALFALGEVDEHEAVALATPERAEVVRAVSAGRAAGSLPPLWVTSEAAVEVVLT